MFKNHKPQVKNIKMINYALKLFFSCKFVKICEDFKGKIIGGCFRKQFAVVNVLKRGLVKMTV